LAVLKDPIKVEKLEKYSDMQLDKRMVDYWVEPLDKQKGSSQVACWVAESAKSMG
jgi:hypothetical protein